MLSDQLRERLGELGGSGPVKWKRKGLNLMLIGEGGTGRGGKEEHRQWKEIEKCGGNCEAEDVIKRQTIQ